MHTSPAQYLRIAMSSAEAHRPRTVLPLAPFNHVPLWSPRVWNGMQATHFGKLLAEYRYRIAVSRLPSAYLLTIATGLPSIVNRWQALWYGTRIARLPLVADPIFVIGHWRTGTTMMHELLSLDRQLASPTTFQCFMPRAFLVTQNWLRPLTARMLPTRRPMDNMAMGWDVPQEDEFALLSMGIPTPYRRMAFPNEIPKHLDYLNMHGIPKTELQVWKNALREFIGNLNYYYRRRLVLKSPPHTGRISVLLDLFPKARFVHIHRSPYEFIPSTIHMWAALDSANGFQLPDHRGLEDFVFDSFDRVYRGFFRDRHLLNHENFVEVPYRLLCSEPVAVMRRLYEAWKLDGFERVEHRLRERQKATRNYVRNRHALPGALRTRIDDHCRRYMQEFGYNRESAAA